MTPQLPSVHDGDEGRVVHAGNIPRLNDSEDSEFRLPMALKYQIGETQHSDRHASSNSSCESRPTGQRL